MYRLLLTYMASSSNSVSLLYLCLFGVYNLFCRYNSPEAVVMERGGDVAVVGRGITKAADPAAAAVEYKKLLWIAYENRISKLS